MPLYSPDSTTIDLSPSIPHSQCPWAHFRKQKGSEKLYILKDLRKIIPSFVEITEEKFHDVNILAEYMPETGSIYIIDHTDIDFSRLHVLTRCSVFFITRSKSDIPENIKKGRIPYQAFLFFEF